MRFIAPFMVFMMFAGSMPVAFAQEADATPAPFPRVRNTERRELAQRLHLRMMDVNQKRLSGYERILERLRNMLERITAIADRREARGADASAVYEAISEARKAIDAAQSAIREQASREYLLGGATDASVRDQLQGMREQLADDLGQVAGAMRAAFESVRDAVRALRNVQKP